VLTGCQRCEDSRLEDRARYREADVRSIRDLMPDIRALKPGPHTGRVVPVLYAAAVLTVFVTTVAVIAVKAGTSSAIVTGVVTVTVAGTAFGLWGAAAAVRDTHDPTRAMEDAEGDLQGVPAEFSVGEPG
jgi:hypothetical protein